MNDVKFAAMMYAQIEVNRPRSGPGNAPPPSNTILNLAAIDGRRFPTTVPTLKHDLDAFIHYGEVADWMRFEFHLRDDYWSTDSRGLS